VSDIALSSPTKDFVRHDVGTLVDVAGGHLGGAARWRTELEEYLSSRSQSVRLIGCGRRLTGRWLLERERSAAGSSLVLATNNVSFAMAGKQRRVLLHNALHFLYPHENHLLADMPRRLRVQIPIVRQMVRRADEIVAPCSAMADRVAFHIPHLRERLVVRMHPITSVGPRLSSDDAFILVPVIPSPYKNLFPQLRMLVAVLRQLGHPARILLTAMPYDLPDDLAVERRIEAIGIMPHSSLAPLWRTAAATFFPSTLEAFGFPLAEARVYGVPVLAPFSDHSRELAGSALRGYDPVSPRTLAIAVERITEPVTPDSDSFDRDRYFDGMLSGTSIR